MADGAQRLELDDEGRFACALPFDEMISRLRRGLPELDWRRAEAEEGFEPGIEGERADGVVARVEPDIDDGLFDLSVLTHKVQPPPDADTRRRVREDVTARVLSALAS